MEVSVHLPDELAEGFGSKENVERRILEAVAAEEYRAGRLTKPQLRRALGFETSYELDDFLKSHQVWIDLSEEELAHEQATLDRLGL